MSFGLTSSNERSVYIYRVYTDLISQWAKDKATPIDDSSFEHFLKNLQSRLDICLYCDDRILQPLIKVIKEWAFLQYNQTYICQNKTRLSAIIDLLSERRFIDKHDYKAIKGMLQNYHLESLLEEFLQAMTFSDGTAKYKKQKEIVSYWRSIIGKNFIETWQFLISNKIYNKLIKKVIEIVMPQINNYSKENKEMLQAYYNACLQAVKKHPDYNKPLEHQFLKKFQKKIKAFEKQLDEYITQKCLYFNQTKFAFVKKQINSIITYMKNNNPMFDDINYHFYGSLKSNFALINHCDADISIHSTYLVQDKYRENVLLKEIEKTLKIIAFIDPSTIQIINGRKPVVRVLFYKCRDKGKYMNTILTNLDITIDGFAAQTNSYVLSLYSQSEYIVKFCCLAKLWAKSCNIINFQRPQCGMSSYGVILMAIFYLIVRDQAPFVTQPKPKQYILAKPLLKQEQYPSLLYNFKGFLLFYSENGEYFLRNYIVCLQSFYEINENLNIEQRKYLINMYDFVDRTNPGRFNRSYAHEFYQKVAKTYTDLDNLEALANIFESC